MTFLPIILILVHPLFLRLTCWTFVRKNYKLLKTVFEFRETMTFSVLHNEQIFKYYTWILNHRFNVFSQSKIIKSV